MIYAMQQLHGERHAADLPLPGSAIRAFAARFGLSDTFCKLVQAYDFAIMNVGRAQADKEIEAAKAAQSHARRGRR